MLDSGLRPAHMRTRLRFRDASPFLRGNSLEIRAVACPLGAGFPTLGPRTGYQTFRPAAKILRSGTTVPPQEHKPYLHPNSR